MLRSLRWTSHKGPAAALLLLGPLICFALPQSPKGRPAGQVSMDVKAVTLYATVRDKHGNIIPNLTKDDFSLTEDGRPQTIQFFLTASDLPLTLGLLVDTSASQRNVLDQERSASQSFLDQMLRDNKDRAFVIHFDREVELLQDLTSSREKLQEALALLHTPQLERRGQNGGGQPPDEDPREGGRPQGRRRNGFRGPGTLLYDAIYLASKDVMQKPQGRKALIILSDGVDRGSQESLAEAMEVAQRADTIVYSILFKDDNEQSLERRGGFGGWGMGRRGGMGRGRFPAEQRPDGKKIPEKISQETGGRLFQVSKKESIDAIYTEIQQELRNQYSLAYTPTPPNLGPGYHKIELRTKKKGLIVQARDGYYSPR